MKVFSKILKSVAAGLLFALSMPSHATLITNTYDPNPDRLITTYNSPFTYTHDLRPDGILGQTINSVDLAIFLYDPTDFFHAFFEKVTFKFDSVDTRTVTNVSLFGHDYTFSLATNLLADGLLNVSLSAGCSASVFGVCVGPQDFVFARSVLTADVSAPVQNVPEPGTLATFAIGLLLLGQMARKANLKR
jgi:hypothetical protein